MPVAVRSKFGAAGSLLVMRIVACWVPGVTGLYWTVKST